MDIFQKAHEILVEELVGEGKEYPVENELYFQVNDAELLYLPDVFDKYVEIYNNLLKEEENGISGN